MEQHISTKIVKSHAVRYVSIIATRHDAWFWSNFMKQPHFTLRRLGGPQINHQIYLKCFRYALLSRKLLLSKGKFHQFQLLISAFFFYIFIKSSYWKRDKYSYISFSNDRHTSSLPIHACSINLIYIMPFLFPCL